MILPPYTHTRDTSLLLAIPRLPLSLLAQSLLFHPSSSLSTDADILTQHSLLSNQKTFHPLSFSPSISSRTPTPRCTTTDHLLSPSARRLNCPANDCLCSWYPILYSAPLASLPHRQTVYIRVTQWVRQDCKP